MAGEAARLFFAAWPAPELQAKLGGLAQDLEHDCGGRATAPANIHLTLVFLGDVERRRVARFESIAGSIAARRFELLVEHVDYWHHNRIVWAGVERCPEALQALVSDLGRALEPEGFRPERRPYVPHITLLRNARRAPVASAIAPIGWPVIRLALVESVRREKGRGYEVLRDWPLTA
jgi:RNA 2',3'-cyclic 3'-phosphodiesterase